MKMEKTNIFRMFLLSSVALAVAACGNLSKVSDEGTTENPVFPTIPASKFNHDGSQFGSWPNWENVRQIEKGMNKDQLYNLIGRPHFEEGLYGVREWDYVFNYRENGVHKMCQFKILFDKNMDAQSFFWYPNGCNGNSSFSLTGDYLFDFDKATLTNKGTEVIDNIAQQLKATGAQKIKVAGYTDRLGSEQYNLDLSQRRSNAVKERLIQQGINAHIDAVGYGKANQIKPCEGYAYASQAEKDCLRPNRRVEISANGGVLKQNESSNVAGPHGPAPLYQTPAYNSGK